MGVNFRPPSFWHFSLVKTAAVSLHPQNACTQKINAHTGSEGRLGERAGRPYGYSLSRVNLGWSEPQIPSTMLMWAGVHTAAVSITRTTFATIVAFFLFGPEYQFGKPPQRLQGLVGWSVDWFHPDSNVGVRN